MIFQKFKIERLFPISLRAAGVLTYTNFGFEQSGKCYYDINIPGRPKIEQGMTVIALLHKKNDWTPSSFLGWVNCLDGSIAAENPWTHLSISFSCAVSALAFQSQAYKVFQLPTSEYFALLTSTIFSLLALRFFYLSIKSLIIRNALKKIRNYIFE